MDKSEYSVMYAVEDRHWWFVSRRRNIDRVLSALVHLPADARIADIGSGTGGMIAFLRRYGSVYGIEPSAVGRSFAKRRGIPLARGRAERTGLPARKFDLVCICDVLYHAGVDDAIALAEAYRLLKPGGYLLVTDSALPWLTGPHDRAYAARHRYYLGEMESLARGAGFHIRYATYMFFLMFGFIAVKRLYDRFFRDPRVFKSDVTRIHPWFNSLCSAVCSVDSAGMPYVRYPWGSSLLVLAQK